MSYEKDTASVTLPSAADYRLKRGYMMKLVAGEISICDTLGEFALGPLDNEPNDEDNATVKCDGIRSCVYGAAVTAGDKLCTNALGKLIHNVTGDQHTVGIALESGADLERHPVLMKAPNPLSALTGTALANTLILVGNGAGAAAAVALSGDATLANTGAITITDVTVGGDAAGDIQYKSSATALARLAKGTNSAVLTMNAASTLPCWDDHRVVKEDMSGNLATTQVQCSRFDGVAHTGATLIAHQLQGTGGNKFTYFPLGAGQTIPPVGCLGGISIAGDETATEGYEITSHGFLCNKAPFIIGLSPAFYALFKFSVENVSGSDDLQCGWRRSEMTVAAWDNYLDAAALGWKSSAAAAPLFIQTILNNGATTETDTTQTLADTVLYQAKILVSAAGVVTYLHDAATPGTLLAPTVTAAFTFDPGDPVIPFFRFLTHGDIPGVVKLINWEVGYQ